MAKPATDVWAYGKSAQNCRNLSVDAQQMRGNVAAWQGVASQRLMLAEAYSFALTPALSREQAKSLVTAGVVKALAERVT